MTLIAYSHPCETIFSLPELGDIPIHLRFRYGTRRMYMKWSKGQLIASAPVGMPMKRINDSLRQYASILLQKRPTLQYSVGQEIILDGFELIIQRQSVKPDDIFAQRLLSKLYVQVGINIDMSDSETTRRISTLLCRMAHKFAPGLLLPLAESVSARIGVSPKQWSISHGHQTLGRCNIRGEIALSEILVFLPTDLREYIICHELAHLSHFNHSPEFHALCNSYLGGREKALITKLKSYNWPILRK